MKTHENSGLKKLAVMFVSIAIILAMMPVMAFADTGSTGGSSFGLKVRANSGTARTAEITDQTTTESGETWTTVNVTLESSDASQTEINYIKVIPESIPSGATFKVGTGFTASEGITGEYTESTTEKGVYGSDKSYFPKCTPKKETRVLYAALTSGGTTQYYKINILRKGYAGIIYGSSNDGDKPLAEAGGAYDSKYTALDASSRSDFKSSAFTTGLKDEVIIGDSFSNMYNPMWFGGSKFYNDSGDAISGTITYTPRADKHWTADAKKMKLTADRGGDYWIDMTSPEWKNAKGESVKSNGNIRALLTFNYNTAKYIYIASTYYTEKGNAVKSEWSDSYVKNVLNGSLVSARAKLMSDFTTYAKTTDTNNQNQFIEKDKSGAITVAAAMNGENAYRDKYGHQYQVKDMWTEDVNDLLDILDDIQDNKYDRKNQLEILGNYTKDDEYSAENQKKVYAVIEKAKNDIKAATSKDQAEAIEKQAEKDIDAVDTAVASQRAFRNTTVTLDKSEFVYDGTAKEPVVTVKNAAGSTLVKDTDYTVRYSNNINAGTATVTIQGKGSYTGIKTMNFAINKAAVQPAPVTPTVNGGTKTDAPKVYSVAKPIKARILKVTAGKKKITVKWAKVKSATGYQLVVARNSRFSKGKKSVMIKSAKQLKKTIVKLSKNKKYYVKVRAYKKVSGKIYYGAFSKIRTIRVR